MSVVLHVPVRGIQREAYGEHDRHCDEDGPPDEVLLTDEEGKKDNIRHLHTISQIICIFHFYLGCMKYPPPVWKRGILTTSLGLD